MSVVGGTEPPNARGRNGTLSAITPRKRSGRRSAACHANVGADVVAGDHRLLGAQSVDEAHDVAEVMEQRVLLDLLRTVASPVAAQVGRHRMETRVRQRPELMPPGIPALGKAVAENDERPARPARQREGGCRSSRSCDASPRASPDRPKTVGSGTSPLGSGGRGAEGLANAAPTASRRPPRGCRVGITLASRMALLLRLSRISGFDITPLPICGVDSASARRICGRFP